VPRVSKNPPLRAFTRYSCLAAFLLPLSFAACDRTPASPPTTNDLPTLLAQATTLLEASNTDTFIAKILDPNHLAAIGPAQLPQLKSQLAAKKDDYLAILRAVSAGTLTLDATGDHATLRAATAKGNVVVQCVKVRNTWYIAEMTLQPLPATSR
jgi:hypothetical protein